MLIHTVRQLCSINNNQQYDFEFRNGQVLSHNVVLLQALGCSIDRQVVQKPDYTGWVIQFYEQQRSLVLLFLNQVKITLIDMVQSDEEMQILGKWVNKDQLLFMLKVIRQKTFYNINQKQDYLKYAVYFDKDNTISDLLYNFKLKKIHLPKQPQQITKIALCDEKQLYLLEKAQFIVSLNIKYNNVSIICDQNTRFLYVYGQIKKVEEFYQQIINKIQSMTQVQIHLEPQKDSRLSNAVWLNILNFLKHNKLIKENFNSKKIILVYIDQFTRNFHTYSLQKKQETYQNFKLSYIDKITQRYILQHPKIHQIEDNLILPKSEIDRLKQQKQNPERKKKNQIKNENNTPNEIGIHSFRLDNCKIQQFVGKVQSLRSNYSNKWSLDYNLIKISNKINSFSNTIFIIFGKCEQLFLLQQSLHFQWSMSSLKKIISLFSQERVQDAIRIKNKTAQIYCMYRRSAKIWVKLMQFIQQKVNTQVPNIIISKLYLNQMLQNINSKHQILEIIIPDYPRKSLQFSDNIMQNILNCQTSNRDNLFLKLETLINKIININIRSYKWQGQFLDCITCFNIAKKNWNLKKDFEKSNDNNKCLILIDKQSKSSDEYVYLTYYKRMYKIQSKQEGLKIVLINPKTQFKSFYNKMETKLKNIIKFAILNMHQFFYFNPMYTIINYISIDQLQKVKLNDYYTLLDIEYCMNSSLYTLQIQSETNHELIRQYQLNYFVKINDLKLIKLLQTLQIGYSTFNKFRSQDGQIFFEVTADICLKLIIHLMKFYE